MNCNVKSMNSWGAYETQIEKNCTTCVMAVFQSIIHIYEVTLLPISLVAATLALQRLLFRKSSIDHDSFQAAILDYLQNQFI